MFTKSISSAVSLAIALSIVAPQSWTTPAWADDTDTARFYIRIPFGDAPEDKPRLGLNLAMQPEMQPFAVPEHEFNVDVTVLNLELSFDGIEQAKVLGFDALLAYDLMLGEGPAAAQETDKPALFMYMLNAGIISGLMTACLVDWCDGHHDKRPVKATATPSPDPVPPTTPVTPSSPLMRDVRLVAERADRAPVRVGEIPPSLRVVHHLKPEPAFAHPISAPSRTDDRSSAVRSRMSANTNGTGAAT